MEIRNLKHTEFDTLFRGFERAFSDYEIHFEKEEVRSMLKRRGYDPLLSFAAFDGGEIVAFTLTGTGMHAGVSTAYDTGTGTAAEYRGQGLAGEIFTYAIPFLKEAGIRQYLLEVLQGNQKAIAVYRRMNFEVTREFDCYRQAIDHIRYANDADTACVIKSVDIDLICQAQAFCDFSPSWQNSIDSIRRGLSDLTCLGAFIDGKMAGYCVFDANTGDLSQIAVHDGCRRRGIASRLLHEAISRMNTDVVKILNIASDDTTLPAFLKSRGIGLASRQYEMILPL